MLESSKFCISKDNPFRKRITLEINKVEDYIEHVRLMKEEVIEALESKKRKLRQETDPNAIYSSAEGSEGEVDEGILDETSQKALVPQGVIEKHVEFVDRKISIQKLDRILVEMDREISRTQAQHDQALAELEQQKKTLKQRLSALEKLDLLVSVLTQKIFETQHDYRSEMDNLLKRKEELLKKDMTKSQMAIALAELDLKISDRKNMHEAAITSLEGQRSELRRESAYKAEHMDDTMDALKMQHDMILAELNKQKESATQTELKEIARREEQLKMIYEKDIETLKQLQEQGWKGDDNQERLSEMLETRGLRVTVSGNFLTSSGQHLTPSEASCMGLLEGLDFGSWDAVLHGNQEIKRLPSDTSLASQGSSTISTASRMSVEDVHYLKTVLGKPLTLALAEITAKQPRDPIHYLGHWLFKYRYNQEIDLIKKQEIQALMNERERLEKEKLDEIIQEESKKAVMEMIIKAEEQAIRNELQRIARETHLLESEAGLDSEARDVLGVYRGPTVGAT